jgi:hypothetical protein
MTDTPVPRYGKPLPVVRRLWEVEPEGSSTTTNCTTSTFPVRQLTTSTLVALSPGGATDPNHALVISENGHWSPFGKRKAVGDECDSKAVGDECDSDELLVFTRPTKKVMIGEPSNPKHLMYSGWLDPDEPLEPDPSRFPLRSGETKMIPLTGTGNATDLRTDPRTIQAV